jgi:hypothetical protein
MQDDNFSPIMTSEEVLAFHAAMQLSDCDSQQHQTAQLQSIAVCQGRPDTAKAQEQDQQQQQQQLTQRHGRVGELAVREVLATVGLSKHATTLVRAQRCFQCAA